uniref:Uncharacterized protein n=1 Tax=Anopheles quadriannulatus TaxID=34691 RepID=A0A1I8JW95_ANOQN
MKLLILAVAISLAVLASGSYVPSTKFEAKYGEVRPGHVGGPLWIPGSSDFAEGLDQRYADAVLLHHHAVHGQDLRAGLPVRQDLHLRRRVGNALLRQPAVRISVRSRHQLQLLLHQEHVLQGCVHLPQ